MFLTRKGYAIHRHTGGLEMRKHSKIIIIKIHRHTGGLEIFKKLLNHFLLIHRHTGGLEKQNH